MTFNLYVIRIPPHYYVPSFPLLVGFARISGSSTVQGRLGRGQLSSLPPSPGDANVLNVEQYTLRLTHQLINYGEFFGKHIRIRTKWVCYNWHLICVWSWLTTYHHATMHCTDCSLSLISLVCLWAEWVARRRSPDDFYASTMRSLRRENWRYIDPRRLLSVVTSLLYRHLAVCSVYVDYTDFSGLVCNSVINRLFFSLKLPSFQLQLCA